MLKKSVEEAIEENMWEAADETLGVEPAWDDEFVSDDEFLGEYEYDTEDESTAEEDTDADDIMADLAENVESMVMGERENSLGE